MQRRNLTSRKDGAQARVPAVFEFRAMVTGRKADLDKAFEVLDKAVERFYDVCDSTGVSVISGEGHVRPMTKEETLAVIPRKWHLDRDGRQACQTPHVSKRYLTQDKDKVTCKLCLREMGR